SIRSKAQLPPRLVSAAESAPPPKFLARLLQASANHRSSAHMTIDTCRGELDPGNSDRPGRPRLCTTARWRAARRGGLEENLRFQRRKQQLSRRVYSARHFGRVNSLNNSLKNRRPPKC